MCAVVSQKSACAKFAKEGRYALFNSNDEWVPEYVYSSTVPLNLLA